MPACLRQCRYPISFELPDIGSGDIFNISPLDGGARLDAAVAVDFTPVLGLRFNSGIDFDDALFVRSLDARFDFHLSGSIEGGVALGPVEASIGGSVSIGDSDLTSGGFTAALTTGSGDSTIPLSALTAGDISVSVTGNVPVNASLDLEVPTFAGSIEGSVGITGAVPGTITFEAPTLNFPDLKAFFESLKPNLRTLSTGAIETARFMARGSDEIADLSGEIPVVGEDVSAQFEAASEILDDVADEIQAVVDFLESEDGRRRHTSPNRDPRPLRRHPVLSLHRRCPLDW